MNKQSLVEQIEALVATRISPVERPQACLHYTMATCEILNAAGIRCIFQAGSCSFKIVHDINDDGKSPNFYSYEFNRFDSLPHIMRGELPEVHVWAALPESETIIDLTTQYLGELCGIRGLQCEIEYPEYLWCPVNEATERGAYYWPDQNATMMAIRFARNLQCAI